VDAYSATIQGPRKGEVPRLPRNALGTGAEEDRSGAEGAMGKGEGRDEEGLICR
jgi:hypothetical protein